MTATAPAPHYKPTIDEQVNQTLYHDVVFERFFKGMDPKKMTVNLAYAVEYMEDPDALRVAFEFAAKAYNYQFDGERWIYVNMAKNPRLPDDLLECLFSIGGERLLQTLLESRGMALGEARIQGFVKQLGAKSSPVVNFFDKNHAQMTDALYHWYVDQFFEVDDAERAPGYYKRSVYTIPTCLMADARCKEETIRRMWSRFPEVRRNLLKAPAMPIEIIEAVATELYERALTVTAPDHRERELLKDMMACERTPAHFLHYWAAEPANWEALAKNPVLPIEIASLIKTTSPFPRPRANLLLNRNWTADEWCDLLENLESSMVKEIGALNLIRDPRNTEKSFEILMKHGALPLDSYDEETVLAIMKHPAASDDVRVQLCDHLGRSGWSRRLYRIILGDGTQYSEAVCEKIAKKETRDLETRVLLCEQVALTERTLKQFARSSHLDLAQAATEALKSRGKPCRKASTRT